MAKLTRTQKYADYRDSLTNDKESSLSTNELSNYRDRLDNITGQNTGTEVKQGNRPEDPKYSWVDFEETPIEQLVNSFADEAASNGNSFVWNSLQEMPPKSEEAQQPQAKPAENPYVGYYNPNARPAYPETPKQPGYAPNDNRGNGYSAPVSPEIAQFAEPVNVNPQANIPMNNGTVSQVLTNSYPSQNYYNTPNQASQYPNTVNPQQIPYPNTPVQPQNVPNYPSQTPVDNHVIDHRTDADNYYLNETMNDVAEYNRANGGQTISQLTNDMINEVRHPGQEIPAAPAVEPTVNEYPDSDEDFSSTVSMEINKLMDEMAGMDTIEEEPELEPVKESPVEEHPVLAKALEEEPEEEVIEIKNLKELEKEQTRDTVSETIPFVVSASDADEMLDDDEEEGSNTVLNVILIILILILVAVLGLIVFYIFKTKGIF
ncbi:MAG: hypothetical protein IJI44_06935 [Erysipelotrichaceae bacterium]|nr:hypothetical protein [Erysipelotrichaceae bacterium]